MKLRDSQYALRMAVLQRHAAFLHSEESAARVRAAYGTLHTEGEVEALIEDGEVRAVIAWREDPAPWSGAPVTTLSIDHPLDREPPAWIDAQLDRILPRIRADLDMLVHVGYRALARRLVARGLAIDSVQLLGDPALAAERLGDARLPEGLRFWPLSSSHVPAVVTLHRETFSREPERCFFGADPRYLTMMQEKLTDAIDSAAAIERVILAGDQVLGHVSATVDHENAFFGPTAGMSLVLAPELRGRGLLRAIYRHLLGAAHERGARWYKGGTNQVPVMRLAEELDRVLLGWNFRLRGPFAPAHFGRYAP